MARRMNTLFAPPKSERLARIITIKSPTAYRESIRKIKKGGVTTDEKRALVLAQNRAKVQLKRKNLSMNERRQFKQISQIKLPEITR